MQRLFIYLLTVIETLMGKQLHELMKCAQFIEKRVILQ